MLVESMFEVGRKTPWAELGENVSEAINSRQAIEMAHLNWNVVQSDIFTGNGTKIDAYKANIRDTDGANLGIVTSKYKIVQNKDAFEFTDEIVGTGDVRYETAGSLKSGKRVWLLAKMPTLTMTDEEFDPYMVFTNSHDGKGAVKIAMTPIRVVCQNSLNLALEKADRIWSANHMGDLSGKMEDAKLSIFNGTKYLQVLEKEFGALKLQKMTKDQVNSSISKLIPIDEFKMSDRQKRNAQVARQEIMNRYLYAPDLEYVEQSAYRFVNAVSDYATHHEPVRNSQNYQENMFMHTVDGNVLIDTAYKIVG